MKPNWIVPQSLLPKRLKAWFSPTQLRTDSSKNPSFSKLLNHSGWLAPLFWAVMIFPAYAQLEMRVAVREKVADLEVGSSTMARVVDASGQVVSQLNGSMAVVARVEGGQVVVNNQLRSSQLWLEPTEGGYVWIGDRWYRGRVLLVPTGGNLTAVNYVDLEQYLYSVLGSEMNGNWPQEALKAQAIAARSYALYQRQTSANSVYDVGNTQAWQVYEGIGKESVGTQTAVDATAGQVLVYNGQIIEAVFHSSAGGHTENVENVWVEARPYLRGVPAFDEGAPGGTWSKTFTAQQLSQRISGVGNVRSISVDRVTPFGRIVSVRVVGDAGTRSIGGEAIRNALGLRSTRFTIASLGNSVASKESGQTAGSVFQISGQGFGHGLGMSQWGAYNLAQKGYNYQQIVLHYYQGATLAKIKVE